MNDQERSLTRDDYEAPNAFKKRLTYAWRQLHWGLVVAFFAAIGLGSYTIYRADWPTVGRTIMFSTVGAVFVIAIVKFVWDMTHAWFRYHVRNITFDIEEGVYYAPPEKFRAVIERIEEIYSKRLNRGVIHDKVWPRVRVEVTQDPPRSGTGLTPSGELADAQYSKDERDETSETVQLPDDDTAIGLAWPQEGRIKIYGPYATRIDGLGWELAHMIDYHIWGSQSERQDVKRRREDDIYIEW